MCLSQSGESVLSRAKKTEFENKDMISQKDGHLHVGLWHVTCTTSPVCSFVCLFVLFAFNVQEKEISLLPLFPTHPTNNSV